MHPFHDLGRRVRTLVSRAKLTLCDVSNPVRALVQLKSSILGTLDKAELHAHYGFSCYPLPGGDLLVFMNTATASHAVAIHCDDSTLRITDLQPGEFGHRDQNQNQIVFRQGWIEITTQNGKHIKINDSGDLDITVAGKVNLNVTGDCDLIVGGQTNLTCTGKVVASASEFDLTGNLKVTGTITSTGSIASTGGDVSDQVRSIAADRTIYDGHKHGNVQNGSGFTAVPDDLQ